MNRINKLIVSVLVGSVFFSKATAQLLMDASTTKRYTQSWTGNRDRNGRPLIDEQWLVRASKCSFEDLWTALKNYGYCNQFEGGFQVLYEDSIMVGRALTAQFIPARPDLDTLIQKEGKRKGWSGNSNSWPIMQLQLGDVYVADGAGKVKEGTLIGDNLGSSIYANAHNGVVFDAGARDRDGLKGIPGFNAWVRGWDPSFLKEMTLFSVNQPIRIGSATVFPGDIVVGNQEGVLFLPSQVAEKVVVLAELIGYRGVFGKEMLSKGYYQPGQIDNAWEDPITTHFLEWLKQNHPAYKITKPQIIEAFQKRSW